MKQSPETRTSAAQDKAVRNGALATLLLASASAAFGYDDMPAVRGETGLWFIALMAAFVAVIFAGFWLHARDDRPPSPADDDPPNNPPEHGPRTASWPPRHPGEHR